MGTSLPGLPDIGVSRPNGNYILTYQGVKYYWYNAPKDAKTLKDMPDAAVTEMANWEVKYHSEIEPGQAGAAASYLNGKNKSKSNIQAICIYYAESADPPPTVGTLPGEGTVANSAGAVVGGVMDIGHFLGDLANPELWVRVAEFIGAGILIAVGVHSAVTGSSANSSGKALWKKVTPVGRAISKASPTSKTGIGSKSGSTSHTPSPTRRAVTVTHRETAKGQTLRTVREVYR